MKNGFDNDIIVGIDIGSENIFCSIGSIENENNNVKLKNKFEDMRQTDLQEKNKMDTERIDLNKRLIDLKEEYEGWRALAR